MNTLALNATPVSEVKQPLLGQYESNRHGIVKTIHVVAVRKDKVFYVEREGDKHTNSMSVAKFTKLFKLK